MPFLKFSYCNSSGFPKMNWIFILCFAHFRLLPAVDLGAKWQPINMWEWLCSLGGCSVATHREAFHCTSLWFSDSALSTRVKHQRQGLTILTLNPSLCFILLFSSLAYGFAVICCIFPSHPFFSPRSLRLRLSLHLSQGLANEERERERGVRRSKWIFSLRMIMS